MDKLEFRADEYVTQKVIVGLSIAGVFVAIGTIVATMWLVRRRRRAAREVSTTFLPDNLEE